MWITSDRLNGTGALIQAVVDTAALVEASRRVALVAERNTALRMVFTDGQVTLDAGTGADASANESVPCTLEGEDIQAVAARLRQMGLTPVDVKQHGTGLKREIVLRPGHVDLKDLAVFSRQFATMVGAAECPSISSLKRDWTSEIILSR